MELETKQNAGILFVKPLENNIDASVSKEFKGKMVDLINQGNKLLILDLSQVEFIDSNGLGSLISILKLLANLKGNIVMCKVRDEVQRLFNLTRLNQVFQIYPNEEEAFKFLNGKPN